MPRNLVHSKGTRPPPAQGLAPPAGLAPLTTLGDNSPPASSGIKSVSESPSPPPQPQAVGNVPEMTVRFIKALDYGRCGEVSLIEVTLPKRKKELRVMKEMENKDEKKCQREKDQFDRPCQHPNMIKYLHYGPSSTYYRKTTHTQLQMELMNLGSLKRVLELSDNDKVKLTNEDRHILCETVGYQMFMALDYFHLFHGGMHRDVKPANILLNTQGRVKLCDFDTSVADSLDHDTLLGTASYAAPEVIQNKSHDFRCDIWGLGTVLFEVATGVHPYLKAAERTLMDAYAAITKPEPEIDWTLLEHMPPSFTDLLKKCLRDMNTRCSASEALRHEFFAPVISERRHDDRASGYEKQLEEKHGIVVSPNHTEKMHKRWKKFYDANTPPRPSSEGGRSTPGTKGRLGSESPKRSTSSEVCDLRQPSFGSPSGSTLESTSTTEDPQPVVQPQAGKIATPQTHTFTKTNSNMSDLVTPLGSEDEKKKEKVEKVGVVMNALLYNWEYAAVKNLEKWLGGRSADVTPLIGTTLTERLATSPDETKKEAEQLEESRSEDVKPDDGAAPDEGKKEAEKLEGSTN